jgi:hypothetical protein
VEPPSRATARRTGNQLDSLRHSNNNSSPQLESAFPTFVAGLCSHKHDAVAHSNRRKASAVCRVWTLGFQLTTGIYRPEEPPTNERARTTMKLPNTALRQVERRITRPTLAAGENSLASRLTLAARPPCLLASRRQATSGSSTGTLLAARTYATVSAAELQFGQPVHETHPHILKAGERKLVCASLLRDHCNLHIQ